MNTTKTIIAAVLIAAATIAHAEKERSALDICTVQSEIANVAMENRQAGTSMAVLLAQSEDTYTTGIIEWAYTNRRWSGEKARTRSIEDFTNEVFQACYETIKDARKAKAEGAEK